MDATNDPTSIHGLRDCGLLKFFSIPGMRAQVELLEYLVKAWDVQAWCFRLRAHMLSIQVEDIYFLTGLSWRGEQENLTSGRPDPRSTLELVRAYRIPKSGLVNNKVPIERIRSRYNRAIWWMIVRLSRSKIPHVVTEAQLLLKVDCVQS